jgi:5-methyltetrahydropteroyltriglutamate--homocysteine methyltransferase
MAAPVLIDAKEIFDRQPIRGYHYWIAGLCAATVLMDGFDTQAIGFVAPALAEQWHIARTALSPVLSSGLVGMLAGALVFGPAGDRWGRKRVLIICTIWFGIGTLLTAQAGSITAMLWLRLVTGFGLGGTLPNATALTSEFMPTRRRATGVTMMLAGFSLGGAVGGVAAAGLMTRFGWQSVFIVGGIVPCITAIGDSSDSSRPCCSGAGPPQRRCAIASVGVIKACIDNDREQTMNRSTDRILTTHVGSLPRPASLFGMMKLKHEGKPLNESALEAEIASAVREIVRKQVEVGLDVISDGEMGKVGFIPYVNERLTGFEPGAGGPRPSSWANSRETRSFPEYYDWASKQTGAAGSSGALRWVCTGSITYKGIDQFQRDAATFRAALKDAPVQEAFIPAISPSNVAAWESNEYYKTEEDFLFAIAEAMRVEYKAIIDAGFLLQVDDPALATYYILDPEASIEDCRRWASLRVEALNHALRGLPEDKIRYHTRYSINFGPRMHDMEIKNILDIILRVNAGAYSFEAANPRHEHEWQLWKAVKLAEGKSIIPGMITQSSVLVEHPELVAQRIARFAEAVGRENVIAGADCGFASFATSFQIHPTIVWAKLTALVHSAKLASDALWGRASSTRH